MTKFDTITIFKMVKESKIPANAWHNFTQLHCTIFEVGKVSLIPQKSLKISEG